MWGQPAFVGSFEATSEGEEIARTYCRPAYATCEAYLDWKNGPDVIPEGEQGAGQSTCFSNDSCGLTGVSDGYCVEFTATTNRCTYECASDDDCKGGATCDLGNSPSGLLAGNGVCSVTSNN